MFWRKGSYVLNSTKDAKERISRLVVLKADDREEVDAFALVILVPCLA